MRTICLIPARLQSSRLPEKLIQPLGAFNVIQTTYRNAVNTGLFTDVIIVCDAQIIADSIKDIGGKAIITNNNFATGTDRIASVASELDADIIINLQGDEPFITKQMVEPLIEIFTIEPQTQVASLMHPIYAEAEIQNPNCVKVICNTLGNAILFSRIALPFLRQADTPIKYYKHIGIYAFTKQALMKFAALPQPEMEIAESLENLRFIYNNIPVRMLETNTQSVGIDTEADLEAARNFVQNSYIHNA